MPIGFFFEQLIKNSVHIGELRRDSIAANTYFIRGVRFSRYIIDVFFTYKYLRIVLSLLFYLGLNKGTILFANHTYGLSNFIQIYASKLGQA